MNTSFRSFIFAIPTLAAFANVAAAQTQAPPDKIPVKLQFLVSAYEGDHKVSSVPYTLLATANGGQVTFLNGINVPILTSEGKITYTNIGTTITCTVTTESGNFRLAINFDEKSVITAKSPAAPTGTTTRPLDSPSFHDLNYIGTITVKDGETKQLISVPDKATGEVEKVEVTLTLETPPRRASIALEGTSTKTAIAFPFSLN